MYNQSLKQKIICPSIQKRPKSNKFFHTNILNLLLNSAILFLSAEKYFSCHWAKIQKLLTSSREWLAQVQRVHKPADLWDITLCTRWFWGFKYYVHPLILRPRPLFYSRLFHLDRLKEGTWIHSFAFIEQTAPADSNS